ncbi:hypothetical protein OIU78_010542 [Salix suchowensis]|nr:hypothetical protein OIU78_010542 [Salix suchowensis]
MAQPLGLEITELRLGLPGSENGPKNEKKRVFSEWAGEENSTADDRKYPDKESSRGVATISMDGAPFLRKVDLGLHKEYSDLLVALEKLFGCFEIGKALKDTDDCEHVPIYEDKDGDWMLVGDVPWE